MPVSTKDAWLRDYDSLLELGARIGIKIRARDEHSEPRSKANSKISKQLQEYQQKLQTLKGSLHKLSSSYSISDEEYDRRTNMVEELSLKYEQLKGSQTKGWSIDTTYSSTGTSQWEGGGAVGRGPGYPERLSMDDLKAQQQELMDEQDKGLDHLSRALRRQQDVGLAIQGEITEHNVLIDEIHDATEKTDEKIKFQTKRVQQVRVKDSWKCTCGLASIIILLLLAIIVIVAVPFGGKG